MQLFSTKLAAWTAVAVLGAGSLFAQAPQAARGRRGPGKMVRVMATYLNLTPDQRSQAQAIFRESNQSAKPIRQQLRQTRMQLRAATKAGNAEQIQQLSAAEGTQRGQLAGIRATAFAKLYKTLTPEQQQKMDEFQQGMRGGGRKAGGGVRND